MLSYDDRTLTPYQRRKILERDDYCCGYCCGPADEVDHIIPWSFVHDDRPENLVASCWLCNRLASDKVFRKFSHKREYILTKRHRYIENNPIPLWLESEVRQLGRRLGQYIRDTAVVCEDLKELKRVLYRLTQEGWRVNIGGRVINATQAVVLESKINERVKNVSEYARSLMQEYEAKYATNKRKKNKSS